MVEIDNRNIELSDNQDIELFDNENIAFIDNENIELIDNQNIEFIDIKMYSSKLLFVFLFVFNVQIYSLWFISKCKLV